MNWLRIYATSIISSVSSCSSKTDSLNCADSTLPLSACGCWSLWIPTQSLYINLSASQSNWYLAPLDLTMTFTIFHAGDISTQHKPLFQWFEDKCTYPKHDKFRNSQNYVSRFKLATSDKQHYSWCWILSLGYLKISCLIMKLAWKSIIVSIYYLLFINRVCFSYSKILRPRSWSTDRACRGPCVPGDFSSWESPQTLSALFSGPIEHVERFRNLKVAVNRITNIQEYCSKG